MRQTLSVTINPEFDHPEEKVSQIKINEVRGKAKSKPEKEKNESEQDKPH